MSGQQRNHHGSVNHLSDSEEDLDSGLSSEPSSPPRSPCPESPQQPLVQAAKPQGPKTPQLFGHGEWKKFEDMFHFVAEMCQWTEQGKLEKLKACLQDQGITYLKTLLPVVGNNYQDLMRQLRQCFQEAERPTAKGSFLHGSRDRTSATTAANRGPLPNIQATLEEVKDVEAIQKSVGRVPAIGRHVEARQSCGAGHPESGQPPSKPTVVNLAVQATRSLPLHQLVATENVPPDKTPRSSPMSSPRGRKPDPDRCFGRNQRSHFHSKCPLTESPKGNGRQ